MFTGTFYVLLACCFQLLLRGAGAGKESKVTPKSLCPKLGLLQRGNIACVKSRYDGRGLECAKMGKWRKVRQETWVNVSSNERE